MVDSRSRWPEFVRVWKGFLDDATEEGHVVVVEGERDRASLRRLGFRGAVVLVHHGRSLSETAQLIARHPGLIVLLTDWDGEGGHLAQRLRDQLEGTGRLDLTLRRRLARVVRGEVVHVEGLAGWARHLAESEGASVEDLLPEPLEDRRPV